MSLIQGGTVCSYSLQSGSGSVPPSGATGSVGVIAPSDCSWSASSTAPWLSITSSGTAGSSDVQYVAQPNTSSTPRSGSLSVAGLTYTVNQASAGCIYSLDSMSTTVAAIGVTSTLGFSTGSSGCSPAAVSFSSWISVSTVFSGSSGTVNYKVLANLSGMNRVGTVQIGDQTFTITQTAAACGFGLSSAGAIYYEDGTGTASGTLAGSWAEQGCPLPTDSTDQPSIISLPTKPSGPDNNIYTLNYGVAPYSSVTLIPRYVTIVFGGQLFVVKQYPFPQ